MPTAHSALVVDADPKGLESLVYGFQGADWRITACPSPEIASLLVKASGAEIVVIASRTEHDKTHTLLRHLRGKDAVRVLPVLVLGPEELRAPLKENGDVDLLPLPAFVRDVLTTSELLVAAAEAQKPEKDPGFEAPVTSALTLSLVRSMNGLNRSGVLRLERKARTGEVMFHQGELAAATIGQLQGSAAIQHLMTWNDGKLDLRLRSVTRHGPLQQSAQESLEMLDRFQRDFAHAIKEIGPAPTVYTKNEERLKASPGAAPPEVMPVFRLCDGQRTISDIIDDSPFRVLDTVRILGRLAEVGILVRKDGKPAGSAPAARGPRDEFLDTARIMGPISAPAKTAPAAAFPTSAPIARPEAPLIKPAPAVAATQAPTTHTPATKAPATQAPATQKPMALAPAARVSSTIVPRPASPVPTAKPVVATPQVPGAHAPAAQSPATQTAAAQTPAMQIAGAITPQSPFPLAAPDHAATTGQASGAFTAKATPYPAAAKPAVMQTPATQQAPATQTAAAQTPAIQPPAVPTPATQIPGMQVSGAFELKKSGRRTQPTMTAVSQRRSVVIDAITSEDVKTPMPTEGQLPAQAPPIVDPFESTPTPPPCSPLPAGSPSARITGVLHATPSRKTATQGVPAERASIQVDQSLASPPAAAETPKSPVVETRAEPHHMHAARQRIPTPVAPGPLPTEPSRRSDSRPIGLPKGDRHESGNFLPVEHDFFDREAELYKVEKAESFTDLDEQKAKAGNKEISKIGRKTILQGSGKRPYRK